MRFEGDGCSYSGFFFRLEPDDGYVPFPLETPNPPETCVFAIFPMLFPCMHPGRHERFSLRARSLE